VPAPADAGRLNFIFIVCDTWSAHWLGCYGAAQVRTPSVDALAARSAMFLDAYPQALPTIPARRAMYTGRQIFPSDMVPQPDDIQIRGWHPLYVEDVTLAEAMRDAGYRTALVTDCYHEIKPGKNFQRGFDAYRYIRGQEKDAFRTGPRKGIDPTKYLHASQNPKAAVAGNIRQFLINRQSWQTEDDWFAAQVFAEAGRWLESNAGEEQPFYLHVESFSPHEMWDPPDDYYRLYMKSDYTGNRLLWPPDTTARLKPVELEHVRALYAGLVTFVDSRVGRFLDKVREFGLMENTVIVFTSDHGTYMGEQGRLHKGEGDLRTQLTHVPLLFYYPGGAWAGKRIGGFVQHTDIMPTLLDLAGAGIPDRVTGASLRPMIEAGAGSAREQVVCGWNDHGTIRTPEWLYQGRWNDNGAAYEELYDVRRDPLELVNVNQQNAALVAEFRAQLRAYVDAGWETTRGSFSRLLTPQG
jgi:arylsulfatase A-like enzyme